MKKRKKERKREREKERKKKERQKKIKNEKKERKTKGIKKNGKGIFSFFLLVPPADSLKPSPQQGAKNTEKQG